MTLTASALRACAYTSEADLEAIAHLINTCRKAENLPLECQVFVSDLKEEFEDPDFDAFQDIRLWRDASGKLVAYADCWKHEPEGEFIVGFFFEIHPRVRNEGLEHEILRWAEQRLRDMGRESKLPLVLHTSCRDTRRSHQQLFFRLGFSSIRHFFRLKRSLQEPIPEPSIPTGWKVRCVDAATEAEAWVEMFNQSFVDHWNHQPLTLELFRYYASLSTYNPNLDLVLETDQGELVTFCESHIDEKRNISLNRKEGHINLLGTRRGFRRRGLARTLLLEGLRKLQSAGMETAKIGVDSENPSGALGLYRSVGFEPDLSSTVFRKVVSR